MLMADRQIDAQIYKQTDEQTGTIDKQTGITDRMLMHNNLHVMGINI